MPVKQFYILHYYPGFNILIIYTLRDRMSASHAVRVKEI